MRVVVQIEALILIIYIFSLQFPYYSANFPIYRSLLTILVFCLNFLNVFLNILEYTFQNVKKNIIIENKFRYNNFESML